MTADENVRRALVEGKSPELKDVLQLLEDEAAEYDAHQCWQQSAALRHLAEKMKTLMR